MTDSRPKHDAISAQKESIMDARPDMKAKALDLLEQECRRLTIESEARIQTTMIATDRPSIAELQRVTPALLEMRDTLARKHAEPLIQRAVPVLLEIVQAAMAWRAMQEREQFHLYEPEERELVTALAKVRE